MGAGRSGAGSARKLRAQCTHASMMAQDAEKNAAEARREAELYSQAARDLEQKVFRSEAMYEELAAAGDEAAAIEQRESVDTLRKLIAENYAKSDQKGEAAVAFEREAFRERDTAA